MELLVYLWIRLLLHKMKKFCDEMSMYKENFLSDSWMNGLIYRLTGFNHFFIFLNMPYT
jgi:hypothetical protein